MRNTRRWSAHAPEPSTNTQNSCRAAVMVASSCACCCAADGAELSERRRRLQVRRGDGDPHIHDVAGSPVVTLHMGHGVSHRDMSAVSTDCG